MPSTFSPSLRIELIGDGEKVGTWGQITNTNLGTLIEQAITGVTTVDITSGNVTLTSYNGAVDEARSAVLTVTGTPGTIRSVIIPNAKKEYMVQNDTTFAVNIKTSAGVSFVCSALSTSFVVCDGLDVVSGITITDGAAAILALADPFASPAFTGVPTAPTAANGTNTTQLATTAFLQNSFVSPAFTGVPTSPTATTGTNTTQLATTAFVQNAFGTIPSSFPSGTRIVFAQTAAPTGWTKITTYNDAALRVVSGTVGSGGTSAFSTVFSASGIASSAVALTTAQMPSHSHSASTSVGISDPGHNHSAAYVYGGGGQFMGGPDYSLGSAGTSYSGTGISASASTSIGSNGSGATHAHTTTMELKYVDTIIASKD